MILGLGKSLAALSLLLGASEFSLDRVNATVEVHQAQTYQQRNMAMNFMLTMRDELRDFMTIFVGRMSNNMIMGTLFLGIAGSFFCEGTIDDTAPDFLHHAFYHCIVIAFIFFGLSMVFALKAISVAYTESRQFLLHMVPDKLNSDEVDYVEKIKEWKKVRPPFSRFFQNEVSGFDELKSKAPKAQKQTLGLQRDLQRDVQGDVTRRAKSKSNFENTGEFNKLWEPSADSSNECMGHGICALCQGLALFALGHDYDRSHWGAANLYVMLSMAGVLGANRMLTMKFQSEDRSQCFCVCIRIFTVGVPSMFLLGDLTSMKEIIFFSFLMMAVLHSLLTWQVLTSIAPPSSPSSSSDVEAQAAQEESLESLGSMSSMLQELLIQSRENAVESMRETKKAHATGHAVTAFAWYSLSVWIGWSLQTE